LILSVGYISFTVLLIIKTTTMKKTTKDYTVDFLNYGKVTVPKGTPVTSNTACGIDENYNFVDSFCWVKPIDGVPQYGLIHDLKHKGLNVPKEYL